MLSLFVCYRRGLKCLVLVAAAGAACGGKAERQSSDRQPRDGGAGEASSTGGASGSGGLVGAAGSGNVSGNGGVAGASGTTGGAGGSGGTITVGCTSDERCPGGFCRMTPQGRGICVPFSQEGDPCGGMPGFENRCAPNLECTDIPPDIDDAPGKCRMPCPPSSTVCLPERYCSFPREVCRKDGECLDHLDCEAPGNDYPILQCLGSVRCTSGICHQVCGASRECRDLARIDFGSCELFLGWAISAGACVAFSGCSKRDQPFFATESECRAACGL
jgi:hypothetical protein